MAINDFAVIGINDVASGITKNMQSRQYGVGVYDSDYDLAAKLSDECASKVKPYRNIKSLVASLSVPRKIFLCKDIFKDSNILDNIIPTLSNSDIIIDMSQITVAEAKNRGEMLAAKSLRYMDVAVFSPYGQMAQGAGIIAGGSDDTFNSCSRILRQLSKEYKGFSGCVHVGGWGSANYTKVVHDSIEASLEQIIADAYFLLRYLGGMKCEEISAAFSFINEELNLYLLKITADILEQKDDENDTPIIDYIIDSASVGEGASEALIAAVANKIPATFLAQTVFMRNLSQRREQRRACAKKNVKRKVPYDSGSIKLLDFVKDALKAAVIIAYSQGFDLLGCAYAQGDWNYGSDEVARAWSAASSIGSSYLAKAQTAFNKSDSLQSLINDDFFSGRLKAYIKGLRETVILSAKHGVAAPMFMDTLSYYDSVRSENMPANLVQSQLNYMRQDTVKRYDIQGQFNVDWIVEKDKEIDSKGN